MIYCWLHKNEAYSSVGLLYTFTSLSTRLQTFFSVILNVYSDPRSNSVATVVLFSVVSVCLYIRLFVCLFVNTIALEPFQISS